MTQDTYFLKTLHIFGPLGKEVRDFPKVFKQLGPVSAFYFCSLQRKRTSSWKAINYSKLRPESQKDRLGNFL